MKRKKIHQSVCWCVCVCQCMFVAAWAIYGQYVNHCTHLQLQTWAPSLEAPSHINSPPTAIVLQPAEKSLLIIMTRTHSATAPPHHHTTAPPHHPASLICIQCMWGQRGSQTMVLLLFVCVCVWGGVMQSSMTDPQWYPKHQPRGPFTSRHTHLFCSQFSFLSPLYMLFSPPRLLQGQVYHPCM